MPVAAGIQQGLEPAVAAAPDIITVWTGSNDIVSGRDPDEFAAVLDELLGQLRERTEAQIFVADLIDLTKAPYFTLFPDPDVSVAAVEAFNARIRASVAAHGCILVHLPSEQVTSSMFSIDGFHPSNEGHELLADAFWAEIEPRL